MRKYPIRKADLEINLAPLIDVVFLLLIFFMVASNLNESEIRATIQLPEVDMKSEVTKSPLMIYLTKSGQVFIEEQDIEWDQLENYLNKVEKKKIQAGVEVYADEEVYFKQIARIMEIAKKSNINQVNFTLQNPTARNQPITP